MRVWAPRRRHPLPILAYRVKFVKISRLCGKQTNEQQIMMMIMMMMMLMIITIAVETLGPINESSTSFLYDLGRRISLVNG